MIAMQQIILYLISLQSIVEGLNCTNNTSCDSNQTIVGCANSTNIPSCNISLNQIGVRDSNSSNYMSDYFDDDGDEDPVFRIREGRIANQGEAPYAVAIMDRGRSATWYVAICGGALIGGNKVLTAATCVATKKMSDCFKGKLSKKDFRNRVVVGGFTWSQGYSNIQPTTTTKRRPKLTMPSMNRDKNKNRNKRPRAIININFKTTTTKARPKTSPAQWRTIRRGRYHKEFKHPANDIAVLYTDKNFIYNSNVRPVRFPTRRTNYKDYSCTMAGYGYMAQGKRSEKLRIANVQVLTAKECSEIISHLNFANFICTARGKSSLEQADAGSPLFCKHMEKDRDGVLVGVAVQKWDFGNSFSGLFTRVSAYKKFINACSYHKYSSLCLIGTLLVNFHYL